MWAWRLAGRRWMVAITAAASIVALAAALGAPAGPLERLIAHHPLSGRWTLWREAWNAMLARPWTGYGPGGFARIYRAASAPVGISLGHDLVLEQAIEAGAGAALGAVALMATGTIRAARGVAAADPLRPAFACIALTLLVSGTYDFTWSYPPLALLAVVALCALIPERSGSERSVVSGARQERALGGAVDHRVEAQPLRRP
jgi:O-antigen ligase